MTTDKMIAEKDGAVGRIIFNNPERRNAVSLEMWEAMEKIVGDFNVAPPGGRFSVEGGGMHLGR